MSGPVMPITPKDVDHALQFAEKYPTMTHVETATKLLHTLPDRHVYEARLTKLCDTLAMHMYTYTIRDITRMKNDVPVDIPILFTEVEKCPTVENLRKIKKGLANLTSAAFQQYTAQLQALVTSIIAYRIQLMCCQTSGIAHTMQQTESDPSITNVEAMYKEFERLPTSERDIHVPRLRGIVRNTIECISSRMHVIVNRLPRLPGTVGPIINIRPMDPVWMETTDEEAFGSPDVIPSFMESSSDGDWDDVEVFEISTSAVENDNPEPPSSDVPTNDPPAWWAETGNPDYAVSSDDDIISDDTYDVSTDDFTDHGQSDDSSTSDDTYDLPTDDSTGHSSDGSTSDDSTGHSSDGTTYESEEHEHIHEGLTSESETSDSEEREPSLPPRYRRTQSHPLRYYGAYGRR
jgi:hypothetical protein